MISSCDGQPSFTLMLTLRYETDTRSTDIQYLMLTLLPIHQTQTFSRGTAFRHSAFYELLRQIFFVSSSGADSAVHQETRHLAGLPLPMLWITVAVVSHLSQLAKLYFNNYEPLQTEHVLGETLSQKQSGKNEQTKFTEQRFHERSVVTHVFLFISTHLILYCQLFIPSFIMECYGHQKSKWSGIC